MNGCQMSKREWKLQYEEFDWGFAAGVCIGMYRDGKPVLRQAVQSATPDEQGFTADQMAGALRSLADWIDANAERLI